jgi:hypothetical protein
VHLHLEDAVAALQVEVGGVFLAIVLELGPAHEAHALFTRSGVGPFVRVRTHVWILL